MRSWKLPYRPLLFVFAAIAVVAAIVSRPDERETLALLERDGQISAVLERIRTQMARPNPDPDVLDVAVRLHLQSGDLKAALAAAELYAAARPDRLQSQVRLLDLLREPTHYARYVALAERIIARWLEPNVLTNLLRHYRLNRNLAAEVRLLQIATGTGFATAADIERLGMVLAAQGDHASATQLLLDGDSTRAGIDRSARITLFHLLVEQGRTDEASRRAMKWLSARPDDTEAAQFCERLAVAGQMAQAVTITQYAGQRMDEIYSACIERAFRLRYDDIAVRLLEGWQADHRAASRDLLDHFVKLALQLARPDIALSLWMSAKAYALSLPTCLAASLAAARLAMADGTGSLSGPMRLLLKRHIPDLQIWLAQNSDREFGRIDRDAAIAALRQLDTALGAAAVSLRAQPFPGQDLYPSACRGESDDN